MTSTHHSTRLAVLFDLDGTLCDTALDLLCALNAALTKYDYPNITLTQAKTQISFGAEAMVCFALDQVDDQLRQNEPLVAQVKAEMLTYYHQHPAWHTRLFPGIDRLLHQLALRHIPWGVVTNKPQSFSDLIIKQLKLDYPPSCVIGGDRLATNKPDPATLYLAAELCQTSPAQCVYIGDHPRDVTAAKNAGMRSIAVGYGYLSLTDQPHTWGADWVVDTPRNLLYCINGLVDADRGKL